MVVVLVVCSCYSCHIVAVAFGSFAVATPIVTYVAAPVFVVVAYIQKRGKTDTLKTATNLEKMYSNFDAVFY